MPQAVTLRDRAAAFRPRFVRDAIVLGNSTVLARRAVERGCYCVEKPDDDTLVALLSLAYEKRIHRHDPVLLAVLRAADVLLKDPTHVDAFLAYLPEPAASGLARLPQAERLLKAGPRPADLEGALRRDRLGLREAPAYAAGLTLCEKGVVLGNGTVIAAIKDSAGVGLVLKGREERILALLSVASAQAVEAHALTKFEGASRALAGGNVSLAAIHLAHVGLPPLAHTGMAKALGLAADELDRGDGPFELLKRLDLLPAGMGYADWSPALRKFNPNHRSPGPGGGQFCSADEGGNSGQATPDENSASIIPAAAQADSIQAKKEKFVDDHLADADKAAQKLRVPVENILGLSALESGWGTGRFAFEGNNYFSMHAPAPFQTGTMTSAQDGKMATFASYADSLNSFIARCENVVQGISDPEKFAAALQNAGLYGIKGNDGTKVPTFVSETADTIRRLRPFITRRKA